MFRNQDMWWQSTWKVLRQRLIPNVFRWLNSRNVKDEGQLVSEMAEELSVPVAGIIPRDGRIQLAEEKNTTVFTEFSESDLAETYRQLAKTIYDLAEEVEL